MSRASRVRSSVWKVSNKRPGSLSLSLSGGVVCACMSVCASAHTHLLLSPFVDCLTFVGYNASDSDSDESEDNS